MSRYQYGNYVRTFFLALYDFISLLFPPYIVISYIILKKMSNINLISYNITYCGMLKFGLE